MQMLTRKKVQRSWFYSFSDRIPLSTFTGSYPDTNRADNHKVRAVNIRSPTGFKQGGEWRLDRTKRSFA